MSAHPDGGSKEKEMRLPSVSCTTKRLVRCPSRDGKLRVLKKVPKEEIICTD